MPDGQVPALGPRQRDQLVALIQLQAHRLFEQQMAACFQSGAGSLEVQVRGQDDVRDVQLFPLKHLPVVGVNRDARMRGLGRDTVRFRMLGNGRELGAAGLCDDTGVMAPPGSTADQPQTNRIGIHI